MCSLCGLLGVQESWVDSGGDGTRRAQRQRRIRLLNDVVSSAGLRLHDWQGSRYVVATQTGRQEIVDDLMGIWAAAERLRGAPLDPLDPVLMARLARLVGSA